MLNRQTFIDNEGWYVRRAVGNSERDMRARADYIDRLAAYENTGLEPNEIAAIIAERDKLTKELYAIFDFMCRTMHDQLMNRCCCKED